MAYAAMKIDTMSQKSVMLAHNDCASTMALGSLRAPSAILSGGGAQLRPMCDPLGGPAGLRRWRPKKVSDGCRTDGMWPNVAK